MTRRSRNSSGSKSSSSYGPPYSDSPRSSGSPRGGGPNFGGLNFNVLSLAILGGVFIIGIGVGVGFSSTVTTDTQNIASREALDVRAPNPEICVQYGASAIAMDMRIFVTLSPFNTYVSQPKMQPACVLRSSSWSILEQRKVVSGRDVNECKNRLNTFAFVGPLEGKPEIDCVYQNDAARNLFLPKEGGEGGVAPETQRF